LSILSYDHKWAVTVCRTCIKFARMIRTVIATRRLLFATLEGATSKTRWPPNASFRTMALWISSSLAVFSETVCAFVAIVSPGVTLVGAPILTTTLRICLLTARAQSRLNMLPRNVLTAARTRGDATQGGTLSGFYHMWRDRRWIHLTKRRHGQMRRTHTRL
jgi:hypothetical protein